MVVVVWGGGGGDGGGMGQVHKQCLKAPKAKGYCVELLCDFLKIFITPSCSLFKMGIPAPKKKKSASPSSSWTSSILFFEKRENRKI